MERTKNVAEAMIGAIGDPSDSLDMTAYDEEAPAPTTVEVRRDGLRLKRTFRRTAPDTESPKRWVSVLLTMEDALELGLRVALTEPDDSGCYRVKVSNDTVQLPLSPSFVAHIPLRIDALRAPLKSFM